MPPGVFTSRLTAGEPKKIIRRFNIPYRHQSCSSRSLALAVFISPRRSVSPPSRTRRVMASTMAMGFVYEPKSGMATVIPSLTSCAACSALTMRSRNGAYFILSSMIPIAAASLKS